MIAADRPGTTRGRVVVMVGLLLSALAVGLAPELMPDSYSWLAHTTSESAAQGVQGAWLSRAGFAGFGAAVTLLAALRDGRWGAWPRGLHAAFGLLMVAAAVFSGRSWDAGMPFDPLEDLLHSVAATAMGFMFALGVFAVAAARWRASGRSQAFDAIAVGASVVLPLGMLAAPGLAGLLQRSMFLVAYLWYGREALRTVNRTRAGCRR